jgi:lipopolysaccharide/colanic/teichoic acid biosynthesis glycosyltransferase
MFLDAEARQAELRAKSEQNGPAFKIANDPRITRVGWFLRKTCLDETPQIFNVLRGEMSLVGPRPLPVVESHKCEMWHRLRLTVLPGLTCIWQVSGGRNVTFEEWMRMDLDYIRNRSVSLDLTLLAKTFLKVVRSRGSV